MPQQRPPRAAIGGRARRNNGLLLASNLGENVSRRQTSAEMAAIGGKFGIAMYRRRGGNDNLLGLAQ